MQIGDEVIYNGRRYAVVGFTPVSVKPFSVELFDDETAELFWVEWPPVMPVERAALRLAPEENAEPPQ
jgi:hypothetical protein